MHHISVGFVCVTFRIGPIDRRGASRTTRDAACTSDSTSDFALALVDHSCLFLFAFVYALETG